MADDANKIGMDCKLYYDSVSDQTTAIADGTQVLITRAIDVECNADFNTGTFVSRASTWEANGYGAKTLELTFGYEHFAGTDTVFDFLLTNYAAKTVTRFLVLDSLFATVGAQGWVFWGLISPPSVRQPLQDGMTVDFTIRTARANNAGAIVDPVWHEIPAP